MRQRHLIRPALPSILLLGCFSSPGQQARTGSDGGHITSFSDYLKAKGFGTSKAELRIAIHSDDPEVRSAASAMLARKKFPDADSEIAAAAARETNEQAKVFMAVTLMNLSDSTGASMLTSICSSRNADPQASSMAATYLAIAGMAKSCIPAQLQRLWVDEQTDAFGGDLSLLGVLYPQASKEQQAVMIGALERALKGPSAYNRLIACDVFSKVDPKAALPAIQAAIEQEQDSNVPDSLEQTAERAKKAQNP